MDLGAIWDPFGHPFGRIWLYLGSFGDPKSLRLADQEAPKFHLIPTLVPRGGSGPILDGFWMDLGAQMPPKLVPEGL